MYLSSACARNSFTYTDFVFKRFLENTITQGAEPKNDNTTTIIIVVVVVVVVIAAVIVVIIMIKKKRKWIPNSQIIILRDKLKRECGHSQECCTLGPFTSKNI